MTLARAAILAVLSGLLAAGCDKARSVPAIQAVNECERCHGYPPAAPHVASGQCSGCHATTVAPDGTIVAGGTHVNGRVDAAPNHPIPYPPSVHGAAALARLSSCATCHGADFGGPDARGSCNRCHAEQVPASAPDWKVNCTFCHGVRTAGVTSATAAAAPPPAVAGAAAIADPSVGAHQAHLVQGAYASALPCSACHVVPADAEALTHFQGGSATVTFSALARQGVAAPAYAGNGGSCAVYCHGSGDNVSGGGSTSIAWTSSGLACDGCHTTAPASGSHAAHLCGGVACSDCHPGYSSGTSVDRARHLDGVLEAEPVSAGGVVLASWPDRCSGCHLP